MSRWSVLPLFFVVACTKSNPAAHCQSGTCTDPAFPFCDANGVVGGEPGACIAVSCTAGAFAECRGDTEVRCNAAGNNYEVVQCERGCDAVADGCRLCNPNETACTNGKVATCDATGSITSSTDCPLGCFESEPRCRDIAPSNSLASYVDMVATPPDLIVDDAEYNSDTGILTTMTGTMSSPPSFMVAAPAGGLSIRVVIVDEVKIQRLTLRGAAAVAIVARGDITVSGTLEVYAGYGIDFPGCDGGYGMYSTSCTNSASGGGGGAYATNGGRGGNVQFVGLLGGAAGITAGSPTLVPLRGGCSGGSVEGPYYPGSGGGALQMSSSTRIVVDGTITARGGNGSNFDVGDSQQPDPHQAASGGGSGGAVLLEAPVVALGANAQLLAFGGDGGALCTTTSAVCGAPGRGAHNGTPATPGGDIAANDCGTSLYRTAGGGGGGLGRVRINTRDGSYMKASSTLEDAVVSTGTIVTR